MAGYKPQANLPFVGVYVAQEKGFFAEENLQVEIQHSAGGGEHLQLLVAGKVDVTTQDAAVLLKRRADPGLPLVSIGLIGQQGQQAYVALADAGIETLDDWRGRRVGFKGTPPPDLLALLDAAALSEDDVKLINVGFDPRVLVEGRVDVYPVFRSNEPYVLEQWGYELRLWEAAAYDIPTLGLTYVATDAAIEEHPERFARFMRAALRGIAYAEAHVEEAVEITLTYTGAEADRGHMRYMLETEIATAHGPATQTQGLGWQTAEQWQALLDSLLTYGAMDEPVAVDAVFTNQFLQGAP
jgi:ABC-type nitrate/sulfonate/bicarbonate transport system substrate-binding protein